MTSEQPTIYVGIDVSKDKLAVAMAGGGVHEEVLSFGTFENTPASVDRLLKRLSGRGSPVSVCYEAGPTGYGLYRQVRAFGFECCVVAPSLIPVRAGERIKTDRLDAIRLARLLRAGELTPHGFLMKPMRQCAILSGLGKVRQRTNDTNASSFQRLCCATGGSIIGPNPGRCGIVDGYKARILVIPHIRSPFRRCCKRSEMRRNGSID